MRLWSLIFLLALGACDDGGGDDPAPTPEPDVEVIEPDAEPDAAVEPDAEPDAEPDVYVPDAAPDVDGPRIIFERPGDSERVQGEVLVELKVRDATGVARVTLLIDDEEVAAFEAEPYEWTWDTSELVEGPHTLKAMAWDTLGNTSEETITANVRSACGDDCPPRDLRFLSPEDGATVCGPLQIELEAEDDVGIASVEVLLDGEPLTTFDAPPYRFDWDTSSVEDGAHELRMVAIDTSGQRAERALTINVANAGECDNPPTVEFMEPAPNTYVSGIVPVRVLALDDNEIKSVTFFVDGQRLIEDATGPYGFDFYADDQEAGEHTIMARAEDRSDQRTSAELTVIVDSVDPTIELQSPTADEVFEGDVLLAADANDDNGIAQVQFIIERLDAIEGEDPILRDEILDAPPWSVTVPEGELPNAPLVVRATVTDISGREVALEPVPFTADPAPVLRFTAPEANARVEGPVQVRVEAQDDVGFADITFLVDGVEVGPFEDNQFGWTPQYWMGERTLRAEGVTLSGQEAVATLTVVVDHPLLVTLNHCQLQPPEEEGGEPLRVCAPMERDVEVQDWVEVNVETEDDDGSIQEIRLLMDGEEIARRDAAGLEAEGRDFGFDTWAFEDGQRTLSAVALSDNGEETTEEVRIRVNNCDRDHDGEDDDSRVCGGPDCNDADEAIHTGANDACDGLDNNCDGFIDESCGEAPTISSVAFYVGEGTLGLEVEGVDPDGDVDRVSIELFDENGGPIPVLEGVDGPVQFALDAVESLDEDGGFRGIWSGAGPAASTASVAVGDASGEMSAARVSIARDPIAAALGEACDPYGGVAACPADASCVGWICAETPAAAACDEAEEIPAEEGGGWAVEGDTLDFGDDSRGTCGGGWAEDRLYVFTAPATGVYEITVEVAEGEAPILYARDRCDLPDGAAELGCGLALQLDLTEGEPTYIYVDGRGGWSGLYTLRVIGL